MQITLNPNYFQRLSETLDNYAAIKKECSEALASPDDYMESTLVMLVKEYKSASRIHKLLMMAYDANNIASKTLAESLISDLFLKSQLDHVQKNEALYSSIYSALEFFTQNTDYTL